MLTVSLQDYKLSVVANFSGLFLILTIITERVQFSGIICATVPGQIVLVCKMWSENKIKIVAIFHRRLETIDQKFRSKRGVKRINVHGHKEWWDTWLGLLNP